jgi:hypothetical protein
MGFREPRPGRLTLTFSPRLIEVPHPGMAAGVRQVEEAVTATYIARISGRMPAMLVLIR